MLSARLRLVHPFPSLLNSVAVFVMASTAGGPVTAALRLAVAMLFIQFAIGTLNDVLDAPRDRDRRPIKPIAAGLVSASTARGIALGSATGGLILVAPSGPETLAVAAAGLGCGVTYDLWLSRTAISWLPLAFALPLVPLYAWLGASGGVPAAVLAVVPVAILAGAGLAIGNALVDLEADRGHGRRTVAVVLGRTGAWATHASGLVVAIVLAILLRPLGGGLAAERVLAAGIGLAVAGIVLALTDVVPVGPPRGITGRIGWALEAVGVAAIGIGWVLAAGATTT
ncbi:MAG: UbiA prenyltransferase family protein [Chloroflexi bacterium]|nr:UbiA prenyltransferase family protein [Chloroflexota bacterium]